MYTQFYSLKEKPFNLTPSPRFLYLGEAHKEALALLKYGVVERKGFILLTGDVGTGKTTVVQTLLASLGRGIMCVYISNPLLTRGDMFSYLASAAFKKKVRYNSKAAFVLDFENFLRKRLNSEGIFLLIIDEAQRLPFALLEEIRLLSNVETAEEKLVNIFLVGQPELCEKLSDPRCRALAQRISVRHHIPPLKLEETREYIATRLKVAGAKDPQRIFSKEVIETIHRFSLGYPRVINILADNVLLLGYSRGKRKIAASMVKECYHDMKLETSLFEEGPGEDGRTEAIIKEIRPDRSWKWTVVAALMGLLFVLGLIVKERGISFQLLDRLPVRLVSLLSWKGEKEPRKQSEITNEKKPIANNDQEAEKMVTSLPEMEGMQTAAEATLEEQAGNANDYAIKAEPKESTEIITVRQGDTLHELAAKVYGRTDERILGFLQRHNPHIKNVDLIRVGDKVIFPPLPAGNERKTYTVHVASFKPFESARQLFQKLAKQGYEVYLMPTYVPGQGKVFRITLGSFDSRRKGDEYAASILRKGIFDYAQTTELEME